MGFLCICYLYKCFGMTPEIKPILEKSQEGLAFSGLESHNRTRKELTSLYE